MENNTSRTPPPLPSVSMDSSAAHTNIPQLSATAPNSPPTSGAAYETRKSYNNNQRGRGYARGNRRQRQRPHEIYKKSQEMLEELFTNRDYKKFHVIKRNDDGSMENIHIFRANNKIVEVLGGQPKRISIQRDGSMLVEVDSPEQCDKIKLITKLDGQDVSTSQHETLNQTKGTIRNRKILHYSDDEILEDLQKYNKNVLSIYRMRSKFLGELTDTGTFVVTFDTAHLPEQIQLAWNQLEVREYIPRPRRCYKCQKFGHGSNSCRVETAICVNCGGDTHGECHKPPKCSNCDGDHPASQRNCFYYQMESEVVTTMTKKKISYGLARREVTSRYVKPTTSYADAVNSSNDTRQQHRSRNSPGDQVQTSRNTALAEKQPIRNRSSKPTGNQTDHENAPTRAENTIVKATEPIASNSTDKYQQHKPSVSSSITIDNNNNLKSIPTIMNFGPQNNPQLISNDRKRERNRSSSENRGTKLRATGEQPSPTPAPASGQAGGLPLPVRGSHHTNRDESQEMENSLPRSHQTEFPTPSPVINTRQIDRSRSHDRRSSDRSDSRSRRRNKS